MKPAPPSFDALVAAYEPGPGPGGLRALVPLAGRPLVEHQLRRAAGAGAGMLLLLVDEVPPELADVVTILRREGLDVRPVRGLDVAADALAPDRPVLLVADACLPEEAVLLRLATTEPPCMATLPDVQATERYERIDAGERWAGALLLDGARVAQAAAMLGSWDAVSTLLRRAVQEGARRLDVGDAPPTLLLDGSEVEEAETRIVVAARPRPESWAERWIEAPLLAWIVPRLLARDTAPEVLGWPGAMLALAAGALGLGQALGLALAALLIAILLASAGSQLARIVDRPVRFARVLAACVPVGAGIALLGLALGLMRTDDQWGWLLAAVMLAGLLAVARPLRATLRLRPPLWLARIDAVALLLAPFALVHRWDIGLAAATLYALATASWLLRALLAQASADARLAAPKLN